MAFIYEAKKDGDSKRELYQATGAAPAAADVKLTYVDDDGSAYTPETGMSYFDDGKGGIKDKEGAEVYVKAGDDLVIPQGYTPTIPVLQSIAVKTAPTKVTYTAGDKLDLKGLVIEATYTDGSKAVIRKKELSFSPAEGTVLATTNTKVTITYDEKTCEQAITVSAAS